MAQGFVAEKWAVTRLNARATWLRLIIRETFAIHQRIIDWDNDLSPDRVPAVAIGLDPMTRKLMRWILGSWKRAVFFNRYLGGPVAPVLELDIVPGMGCAAHFAFTCPQLIGSRDDTLIATGQALQRFWLTATSLGLVMQPAFATLAFTYYGERGTIFSAAPRAQAQAKALAGHFKDLFDLNSEQVSFIGRIGRPRAGTPAGRSVRRSLNSLIV